MFGQAAKVMSWINWIQMAVLGAYTAYYSIANYEETPEPTRIVLSVYLCLFGIVGILVEVNVKRVVEKLQFLATWGSKGWFFFFCGSLGMSFGWQTKPAALVIPFVMGIYSMVAAIICWLASCYHKEKSRAEAMYETVRDAAPSKI